NMPPLKPAASLADTATNRPRYGQLRSTRMIIAPPVPCAPAAIFAVLCAAGAGPAAAQNEAVLKSFFEGKRLTLKIDMPGSSDGVDVRGEPEQASDHSA